MSDKKNNSLTKRLYQQRDKISRILERVRTLSECDDLASVIDEAASAGYTRETPDVQEILGDAIASLESLLDWIDCVFHRMD